MGSAHDRRIFDRALQRFIASFLANEIAQPQSKMGRLLDHPKLWGGVGLVALAVSFSPRSNLMATRVCLALAWITWTAMMYGIHVQERRLRLFLIPMFSLFLALAAYVLGSWLVPDKPSASSLVADIAEAVYGRLAPLLRRQIPPPASTESEDDRLNDRYLKAVSQLGNSSDTVRIGAIYTLERIATDSPKHQRQVVELLINTLKKEAPQKRQLSTLQPPPMSLETQAILDVLGRRPVSKERLQRIDLGNLDLHNANLNDGRFDMAFLAGSNLFGAFMNRAYFRGADLRTSDLSLAEMTEAHMEGADLKGCKLYGIRADRAVLTGAKLIGVLLASAELRNARLDGAVLCADLRGAILSGASLRHADLSVIVKWEIDPSDGVRSMNRSGRTEMDHADLTGADLSAANVSGVDLTGVRGLTREQISKAVIDHATILPVGMR